MIELPALQRWAPAQSGEGYTVWTLWRAWRWADEGDAIRLQRGGQLGVLAGVPPTRPHGIHLQSWSSRVEIHKMICFTCFCFTLYINVVIFQSFVSLPEGKHVRCCFAANGLILNIFYLMLMHMQTGHRDTLDLKNLSRFDDFIMAAPFAPWRFCKSGPRWHSCSRSCHLPVDQLWAITAVTLQIHITGLGHSSRGNTILKVKLAKMDMSTWSPESDARKNFKIIANISISVNWREVIHQCCVCAHIGTTLVLLKAEHSDSANKRVE